MLSANHHFIVLLYVANGLRHISFIFTLRTGYTVGESSLPPHLFYLSYGPWAFGITAAYHLFRLISFIFLTGLGSLASDDIFEEGGVVVVRVSS
jgi:ABC-type thiamin/hydroxymethylpyrimidine transport system permease subunit